MAAVQLSRAVEIDSDCHRRRLHWWPYGDGWWSLRRQLTNCPAETGPDGESPSECQCGSCGTDSGAGVIPEAVSGLTGRSGPRVWPSDGGGGGAVAASWSPPPAV